MKIFGHKGGGGRVIGEWRTLHSEELHVLYSSSYVRVILSRYVCYIWGKNRMHTGFLLGNVKAGDNYEDNSRRWGLT